MNIKNNQFTSIEQFTGEYLNTAKTDTKHTSSNLDVSFAELLQKKQQTKRCSELKFSKHADARLTDRNIVLSQEQMQRLEDGALKAGAKGIKDSLVIMDGYAFIVNTKSNTVITAMEQNQEQDNIYTNIDGAVVI